MGGEGGFLNHLSRSIENNKLLDLPQPFIRRHEEVGCIHGCHSKCQKESGNGVYGFYQYSFDGADWNWTAHRKV